MGQQHAGGSQAGRGGFDLRDGQLGSSTGRSLGSARECLWHAPRSPAGSRRDGHRPGQRSEVQRVARYDTGGGDGVWICLG